MNQRAELTNGEGVVVVRRHPTKEVTDRQGGVRIVRDVLPVGHVEVYQRAIRTGAVVSLSTHLAGVARRLPNSITLFLYTHHEGVEAWCLTHRKARCSDDAGQPGRTCQKRAEDITVVTVAAHGLPVYDGTWSVAGILSTDAEGVVTATTCGGRADGWAARYAELAGSCAHCQRRRRRSVTVLLADADDQVRPVGRTCLGDYTTGAIRAEVVAALLTLGERIQATFGVTEEGATDSAPVEDIVAVARLLIERYGFVRSGEGGRDRDDTRTLLRKVIAPAVGEKSVPDVVPAELTDEQRAAARADIAAIADSTDASDYMANLRSVVAAENAQIVGKGNKLGLLASLPVAADRMRAEAVPREAEVSTPNEYIGSPGDQVTVTGTLTASRVVEGYYGTSQRMAVETERGLAVWFTTARGLRAIPVGTQVTVDATVKAHNEYRARRETVLARPKLVVA